MTDAPDTFTLPKKRKDGETLKERMTENAYNRILPARYLNKDDNGEVIETPEELFQRVAENVAQPAKQYDEYDFENTKEEFYNLMTELKFMPNSPTLMNMGDELQMGSACISGDTLIYTEDGMKRMDEVEVGDKVFTHRRRFKEVEKVYENGIKKTKKLSRGKSKNKEHYSLTATPDHELYTETRKWEEAEEVENPMAPVLQNQTDFPTHFYMSNYNNVEEDGKFKTGTTVKKIEVDNNRVKLLNSADNPKTGRYAQNYNQPRDEIINNRDIGFLIGVYLADGDIDGSAVRFTFNENEEELISDVKETLEKRFGLPIGVENSNSGAWITLKIQSNFVANFFEEQCGSGVTEKSLPKWVGSQNTSEGYRKAVFKGIMQDAHRGATKEKLQLANPTLAYETLLLGRTIGKTGNFKPNTENELSQNPTATVTFGKSTYFTDSINKKENGKTQVYDLQVKDDHSYVAGDFIVHNCFVLHPEDDMEDIFNTARDAAMTFKDGGGMGYPFHLLRPKGDRVKSTGGISSGPLSFMEVFDTTCGTIKQGGVRRGAQMGIMRVDHPDILRFIVSKRKEGKFSNFNISVGFTEEFMEAVKNDEEYELINPRTGDVFQTAQQTKEFYTSNPDEYPEAQGSDQGKDDNFWRDFADNFETDIDQYKEYCRNQIEVGEPFTLPARFIFEAVIDGAWRNGEPGFYNYSEYNDMHSYDLEKHPEKRIEACNPCGEQGLMNGEACNLGHVNLSLLVEEDAEKWMDYDGNVKEYVNYALDKDELERICRTGTRFLDNVVDMNDWPTDEIEETAMANRKIGLGLMGFAQMLIQMGIRYGSEESVEAAKEVQRLITKYAVQESHRLAETKGKFPNWEQSKWADPTEYEDWFEVYAPEVDVEKHSDGYEARNHNMVTIAPTGTTSMLADTSGGCEPIFSLAYFKNVAKDIQGEDMLVEFDDYFLKALEHNNIDVEKVKEDAKTKMENNEWEGVQSISDDILPPRVKNFFATADQVTPEEHMEIQAAFQEHNHSGISKTCNFPNSATRKDVKEAYLKAHELGIKGMTVYRDGSRDTQVMQTNKDNKVVEKIDILQWLDDADKGAVKEVHNKIEEKILSKGGD